MTDLPQSDPEVPDADRIEQLTPVGAAWPDRTKIRDGTVTNWTIRPRLPRSPRPKLTSPTCWSSVRRWPETTRTVTDWGSTHTRGYPEVNSGTASVCR